MEKEWDSANIRLKIYGKLTCAALARHRERKSVMAHGASLIFIFSLSGKENFYSNEKERRLKMKKLKNPNLDCVLLGLAKLGFAMMTCCELYYFSPFLTNGARFSAAAVAMILSITSTIDFIASFLIGFFLELVHMPWGKYRSWLLVAPIGVLIFGTLFFIRISDNEMISSAFIIVTFVLAHVIWSIGEAAVNSMSLVMTDDIEERGRLSVWLGRGSMGNTLVFGVLASPILGMLGDSKYAYAVLAIVFEVIYLIAFWALFFKTKGCEDTAKSGRKVSLKESLGNLGTSMKYAVTNRHLIVTMLIVAGTYCYMITQSASMFYYFNYTLGGSVLGIMSLVITLISAGRLLGSVVVVGPAMKLFKGNKQKSLAFGFFALAVIYIITYVLRPSPYVAIGLILFASLFGSLPLAMWPGLFSDCAVYSEWKAKKDVKGFIMGLSVMPVKLGITARSFILSAVLVGINYSADAVDTSAYPDAFAGLYLLIPAIVCIVVTVIHLLVYRLNEQKITEMQAEIMERKGIAAV